MGARSWLAGAVVAGSYLVLRSEALQEHDRRAGTGLARPLGEVADTVLSAVTDLGSLYGMAGMSGALAVAGHRRAARDVAGAGIVAWTVAQAAKPLVDRPRPYESDDATLLIARPAGASWPSGHVSVAAGMAAALADDLPVRGRSAAALLAGVVAFSRIYVGAHHLSDVVAGLGLGVLSEGLWRRGAHRVRSWWRRAAR